MTPDFENSNRLLLELAVLLEGLPVGRFNYRWWVGDEWMGSPDLSCGTTACALGWATTMPELRRAGLFLRFGTIMRSRVGFRGIPENEAYDECDAGAAAFGITRDEAEYLFCPDTALRDAEGDYVDDDGLLTYSPLGDATAQEVATHIRSFVEWRQKRAALKV